MIKWNWLAPGISYIHNAGSRDIYKYRIIIYWIIPKFCNEYSYRFNQFSISSISCLEIQSFPVIQSIKCSLKHSRIQRKMKNCFIYTFIFGAGIPDLLATDDWDGLQRELQSCYPDSDSTCSVWSRFKIRMFDQFLDL